MDASAWTPATLWWIAAGVLVAVELASGTFYLLMLALGAVAAALAAHAGAGAPLQWVAAALCGSVATAAWHLKRRGRAGAAVPAQADAGINLDIGQTLHVDAWGADGSARVAYRGAQWTVEHAGDGAPRPGVQVIVAVDGSRLRVRPR